MVIATRETLAIEVPWPTAYRIIPSHYPPINVFEGIYQSADEMELAFFLDGMTNDRLLNEVGDLALVPKQDWVFGPGASAVMAAFTHIGIPSRFTDGAYGVYYAADSLNTAIAETAHHRTTFLRATAQPDQVVTMRVYCNRVREPMQDVRGEAFQDLHDPNDYALPQRFAADERAAGRWGLLYRSVRNPGGLCIAAFRPRAVTLAVQASHLEYVWDGQRQAFSDFRTVGAV